MRGTSCRDWIMERARNIVELRPVLKQGRVDTQLGDIMLVKPGAGSW